MKFSSKIHRSTAVLGICLLSVFGLSACGKAAMSNTVIPTVSDKPGVAPTVTAPTGAAPTLSLIHI